MELLGGHPALDLLNTSCTPGGVTTELIPDGDTFIAWLLAAGLLGDGERFSSHALDEAAAEARRFREWARAWIEEWRRHPRRSQVAQRRHLNALLARAPFAWELGDEGLVARPRLERADALIGVLALALARLVAAEDPARVKRCAGPSCSLLFVDRSKAQRRRFCSPMACGNRAKVAAFRARQRAEDRG